MITLQDCGCVKWDKKLNNKVKEFLGSIIIDKGIIQNKQKLFYNDIDLQTVDNPRVLDDKLSIRYKPTEFKRMEFAPHGGVIKEFFNNKPFVLELPTTEGLDITANVIHHFLGPLAKSRVIDDLLFTILRNIFSMIGVKYNSEKNIVGFGTTQNKSKVKDYGSKTYLKFDVNEVTLEEVLKSEVEQGFVNELIGDPNREFAYTHLLRQHAEFKLTNWAKTVLMNWNRYNILATSRGQGKTMLAAFVATRGLLDPRKGYGGRKYKEIKYFVPDKENVGNQVMEYILSMIGDLRGIKLETGRKAFEVGNFEIKCNITGNVFKIVSLYNYGKSSNELGSSLGEGLACDLAIIDEAARIPDDFWISFHQRAAFETSEFFLISTINEETPASHRFYRLLIDGETGVDKEISSYRIDLDMNEVMRFGKTEEQWKKQIEKVKEELRKKGDKEFYSKGYCMILEESNVFNIGTAIVNYKPEKYADTDLRILGFDLGKLEDTAGLTIINLNHLEVESSIKVNNLTYGKQLEYAEDYKKKYSNIYVIGDRSGVGEAVSEQDLKGVVDVWIKSTGTGELNFNKKYKYYTCNKGFIITTLAGLLNSFLKIPMNNVDLIDQLNNFIKVKSGRGETILYKGKGKKKDDLVLSLAYATLYIHSILGLKTKEDIQQYINEIGNNQTYYYNNDRYSNNDGYYGNLY